MDNRSQPVIPLPNPGEGGAVYPGEGSTPVPPLPNPGEGGPVYPGAPAPGRPIIVQPLPDYGVPLPARYAVVRFFNATHGYAPFRIFIDGVRAVSLLDAGRASAYVRIPSGIRTVSVVGQDGYTYIEQRVSFAPGSASTVALVNRAGGLGLIKIADAYRAI